MSKTVSLQTLPSEESLAIVVDEDFFSNIGMLVNVTNSSLAMAEWNKFQNLREQSATYEDLVSALFQTAHALSVRCCLICDAHGVITCLCNTHEDSGIGLHHESWWDCIGLHYQSCWDCIGLHYQSCWDCIGLHYQSCWDCNGIAMGLQWD